MGGLSIWHWLIVGVIILLLFGKGRFSDMMGDVAKGLKSFKKGMAEDDEPTTRTPPQAPPRLRDESNLEVPVDRTKDIDGAGSRREP
ncbi:twin-arginine translocase TatA/TatE family subunit [Sphingomonas parva]|uniref:Sec-independent protein translocase protein TatA n=1 Tax=Sphingomonas parva TaxID=2555898 RepID=A0A4Y8ZSE9_9SPHN|nr:twin-arginine translocase TatA/TatE family subunit [Sphingomonas parva]TFI58045.1 twin-arginine translocase TatA/TatE family subunit [Sphingomonas parva]